MWKNLSTILAASYIFLAHSVAPSVIAGDWRMLEIQDIHPRRPMERPQIQGPWGGDGGDKFFDVGTSINRVKLRYSQSPGLVGSMEVDYKRDGSNFVKRYCDDYNGDLYAEIVFEENHEFITHISGYVSQRDLLISGTDKWATFDSVASLTIHTNIKSYGPFGIEKGEPFKSDIGRVVGFHGGGGALLDGLGVVIILDDTS